MARQQDAGTVLQRWATNTIAAANGKYKTGVMAVTTSPTEKAAAAVGKYQAGVNRAVADGSYVDGLRKVSLTQWQQAAANKGAANIAAGVEQGKAKVAANLPKLLALTANIKDTVSTMDKGTTEAAIARVRYAITAMKEAYGKS